jgi:aspartate 1-decarboxylase
MLADQSLGSAGGQASGSIHQRKKPMRLRSLCTAKIHHARVTEANVEYVGSIGIDRALLELVDILPGEKVAVWNVRSGARIETYAIPAPRNSGQIIVNGAAAHHFEAGDRVIVAAFSLTDEPIEPRMIMVDEQNEFAGWLHVDPDPAAVQEMLS